jgi:hypothetical membrane protein
MGRLRKPGAARQNAGVAPPAPRGRLRDAAVAAGIVGPGFFISDWAVLGTRAAGYSPVRDAISELARMHATTRPAMTAGFVVLGAAVPAYGLALRDALPGPAWRFALVHGVATLGVAAFALGTPTSGKIHGAFAGVAYATLAAVPIAASVSLRRRGGRGLARASMVTGIVCAAALVASVAGPTSVHGLLQRIGLTIGDAWLMTSAVALLTQPAAQPATQPDRAG